MVDDGRQLAIALDHVAQQVGDHLLVRHGQHHVAPGAVLEAQELGADLGVSTGLLPQIGGMDDRHLHLLSADAVDLLADHLLDPLLDPEAERQEGVDPRAKLADVAGTHQELVRHHLGLGRIVAEGREEELGEAHGALILPAPASGRSISRLSS